MVDAFFNHFLQCARFVIARNDDEQLCGIHHRTDTNRQRRFGHFVYIIIKKDRIPGILAAVGFFLIGVNILTGLIFSYLVIPQVGVGQAAGAFTVSRCISGLLAFFGSAAMIAALFMATRSKSGNDIDSDLEIES